MCTDVLQNDVQRHLCEVVNASAVGLGPTEK